ncbi:hypothetical protein GCM10017786_43180 [Amycolatopsis deserti]|uniref:Uncharacterized protein n=1 Tax=Amycolatopsis deserti TaxID=185696 RepID=A0ABQ3J6Z9_9PSEU|nr:hypothetical protein GCM10017786_43180 [Amycolatopsis deserti]
MIPTESPSLAPALVHRGEARHAGPDERCPAGPSHHLARCAVQPAVAGPADQPCPVGPKVVPA